MGGEIDMHRNRNETSGWPLSRPYGEWGCSVEDVFEVGRVVAPPEHSRTSLELGCTSLNITFLDECGFATIGRNDTPLIP